MGLGWKTKGEAGDAIGWKTKGEKEDGIGVED